mmetsp:Transcript_20096/g.43625  ORF Transcript_20096/g.43625 Transcript_20096/m.43625 type:complete len:87 (+) Transcript_20096:592-852(+)
MMYLLHGRLMGRCKKLSRQGGNQGKVSASLPKESRAKKLRKQKQRIGPFFRTLSVETTLEPTKINVGVESEVKIILQLGNINKLAN